MPRVPSQARAIAALARLAWRPLARVRRPAPQRLAVSLTAHDLLIINGDTFQPGHDAATALELADVNTFFRGIDDIAFSVGTGHTYAYETVDGRDLADFSLIQVAAYPRPTATLLSAISVYLSQRGRPPLHAARISAPTKLCQLMKLAHDRLPVPATLYLSPRMLGDSFGYIASQLGVPFVLKSMNGSGGRLNFLIKSEDDFQEKLGDPAHAQVAFLVQRFIPSNGTFRILVFGEEIPIIMHRCSTDGTHLSNTEQGGHATLFGPETFDAGVMAMVRRATAVMGYQVAGVNVLQDRRTQKWYLLEVNCAPAIGSGAFATEKTRAYARYLQAQLSL